MITISFVLGLQLFLSSEWRQSSLIYVESDQQIYFENVQNTGAVDVTIAGRSGVDGPYHQWILGAATSNPPTWDTRFTPLHTGTISDPWSFDDTALHPNYIFVAFDNWGISSGHQSFNYFENDVDSGTQIRRDKDWHAFKGFAALTYRANGNPGGGG